MESGGIQRRHLEMTVSRALLRHQQSCLYTIGGTYSSGMLH